MLKAGDVVVHRAIRYEHTSQEYALLNFLPFQILELQLHGSGLKNLGKVYSGVVRIRIPFMGSTVGKSPVYYEPRKWTLGNFGVKA